MTKSQLSAKLDWNRLLGFEQITEHRSAIRQESAGPIGPKVGQKAGVKAGVKLGTKVGTKVGTKAGLKA